MKRILYLSFYFEPDLCAGSFRNSPLAKELAKQLKHNAMVDVITTLPNRYSTYATEASAEESFENLNIKRIKLPVHKNGFIDQIFAFQTFYFKVLALVKGKDYDLIFSSSSRLFTAFLGFQIARKKKIPLVLDIRDIFTDTINDVIPFKLVKIILLPVLRFLEGKTFNYASHINLISEGFKEYFKIYQKPNYSFFTNGIDQEFIHLENYIESLSQSKIIITYAGNIGEGQGLHKIIPKSAKLLGDRYWFRIIGDGGAKLLLETELKSKNVTNVSIENPVKRSELLKIYKESHFLFMHLNDYKAFEKVLPSKVFELGAFPRPIIAGVNGYSKMFIEKYISNAILIKPTNSLELVEALQDYKYTIIQRREFIKNYDRRNINNDFASVIIQYLK